MAITFPGSPSVGQLVTQNSRTYQWTGKTWDLYGNVGVHKSTHATGGSDALTPADIGAAPADSPAFTGNVGIGAVSGGSKLEVIPGGGQGINCLNNGGTGTVNYAVMGQAAGSASANTGVYANAYNGASNYGVRIVNPPASANNWAIYSDASAQSYFSGSIGIGTLAPSQKLDVNGNIRVTGNISKTGQSAATDLGLYSESASNWIRLACNAGDIRFFVDAAAGNQFQGGTAAAMLSSAGNFGIGTSSPTLSSGTGLHCAGSTFRLGTARTPASSTATGNTGEICWDASYLYVCVNTNTWRRIAHSTW
jgi:hypothetical protein